MKRHVFDLIDCRGTPLNKLKIDFYPNVVAWHNLNMHLKSFLFHSPPIFSFIFCFFASSLLVSILKSFFSYLMYFPCDYFLCELAILILVTCANSFTTHIDWG